MHLLRYAASVALVVFLGISSRAATAGPGDLDSNFGQGGRVASDFKGSNGFAYAVALQSDEKIVTAGIRFVGISAEGGDFTFGVIALDRRIRSDIARRHLKNAP